MQAQYSKEASKQRAATNSEGAATTTNVTFINSQSCFLLTCQDFDTYQTLIFCAKGEAEDNNEYACYLNRSSNHC